MKLLKTILLTAAAVILACCSGPEGFSDREKTIIRQSDSVMYVYSTGKRSDSLLLRLPSQDIPLRALRGEDYRMLAAKMLSTVTSPGQDGVGIAAPQVGINRRVVAVWRSDKDGQPFEVYPNVRIDSLFGDLKKGPEGCLSVPPYRGVVPRWTDAIVSYTDPQTLKSRRDTVHGYTAVIFQHECDHLDGVLYTDRADSVWRNEAWAQERCAFNHPIPVLPDTLRIFAIGNSFSDDGMDRLPEILEEKGIHNVILGRLYIGGCSLERHVHEYEKGGTKYKYYKSTANRWETLSDAASMLDGLCDEPWDVISLQQVSGLSGDYSSFKPWLDSLVHIVRGHATNPSAAIVWHQTWSYAKCSSHPDFPRYHCDQHEMDLAIAACVDSVRRNHGIVTVIPSGPAITRLRESAPADSLDYTRDGFHLNYQEGRRTAAQAWYEAIVEKALPQPEPGKGAQVIAAISKVIWSPALVVLLIFAGLFFSFGTRFVQIRHFKDMLKSLFAVKAGKGKGISSFEAFCMALSGRIGTGNIVGVATAIAIGGAGSVFWMWLIAFFGAATAFMESTLAQKYKFHHETGFRGGPFSYIEAGLGQKWLGVLFALSGVLGYGICLVTVQANGLGTSMSNAFQVPPLYAGIGLAIVLGIVIFGGVKSISRVSSIITPFMALGYIIVAIIVICFNIKDVPGVFGQIFRGAFNFGAAGRSEERRVGKEW